MKRTALLLSLAMTACGALANTGDGGTAGATDGATAVVLDAGASDAGSMFSTMSCTDLQAFWTNQVTGHGGCANSSDCQVFGGVSGQSCSCISTISGTCGVALSAEPTLAAQAASEFFQRPCYVASVCDCGSIQPVCLNGLCQITVQTPCSVTP